MAEDDLHPVHQKIYGIIEYYNKDINPKLKYYGLQVEILASAFEYLKANPKVSIVEALDYGIEEWIK